MTAKQHLQKILLELEKESIAKLRRRVEETMRNSPNICNRIISEMILRGEIKSDDVIY